jgi:hypothetical protein
MFGIRRIHNFLRLPSPKRHLIFKAFYGLTVVRVRLRFQSFQALCRQMISRKPSFREQQGLPRASVQQIVWAVQTSARYMPGGAKCLAKALTTQNLMRAYGYVSELKIGVTKSPTGQFEAHAWIEYNGQVVIGQLEHLSQFTPLPPLTESALKRHR